MGKKLSRVSGRQVEAAFRKLGFVPMKDGPRWKNPDGRMTVIHLHPTQPVPVGTLRHILSLARVSVEDFADAL